MGYFIISLFFPMFNWILALSFDRLFVCLFSYQEDLKRNATVTMNRAPMINQNITFHLPKYNSNMFCVLKVITDKLTLLCLTMYSAIFLQSLL